MASLNKVFLMGNLTRDIEMRFTPSGMAVGAFGLAVNRKYRDKNNELKEEVTFVDIEMFGKMAENAHKYLSKGRPVFIEGRLKLDQWDDKQTGQKRSKMKVVADGFQFVGGPGQGSASGQGGETGGFSKPRSSSNPRSAPPVSSHDDMGQDAGPEPGDDLNISEENIPF